MLKRLTQIPGYMGQSRQVRSYRRSAMDGSSKSLDVEFVLFRSDVLAGRYPFCSVVLWDRTAFVHGEILFMKVRL